ncbi:hypothetical protein SAMN05421863_103033 [Nitrosomonas communis]|uniref:Uncharacterized protein n=1 Tax=Nitrosomonas communis TaxID=44574 RepID=A0A1I4R6A8_9PROT|nr:hypothetical protein SAMN05421863_103033 [Nitrosomonas communis]
MVFLLNTFKVIGSSMILLLMRLMALENFKLRLKNLKRP